MTKGIPFTKIEVRPDDQLPKQSYQQLSPPSTKTSISFPSPFFPVPATPSVAAGALSAAQQRALSAELAAATESGGNSSLPRIGNGLPPPPPPYSNDQPVGNRQGPTAGFGAGQQVPKGQRTIPTN